MLLLRFGVCVLVFLYKVILLLRWLHTGCTQAKARHSFDGAREQHCSCLFARLTRFRMSGYRCSKSRLPHLSIIVALLRRILGQLW